MMAGWQKPVSPPRVKTWTEEVVALYVRHPDMEAEEFERLYEVALSGERPEHPELPAYLPGSFPTGLPPIKFAVGGMPSARPTQPPPKPSDSAR